MLPALLAYGYRKSAGQMALLQVARFALRSSNYVTGGLERVAIAKSVLAEVATGC